MFAGAQTQIEHQRQAIPLGDRPDLVLAVGVERSERQLGGLGGGHFYGALAPAVTDDDLASGARDGQRYRQRGDHAVSLLGVAVGGEEAARLVDQQLVEPGVQPVGGTAEAVRRRGQDPAERIAPPHARQTNLRGVYLPAVAHCAVDQRCRPLAVRCTFRDRDQCLDLRFRHRKRQSARALHVQPRHGRQQPAVRAEIAGPVDRQEQLLDRLFHLASRHVLPPSFDCPLWRRWKSS